MVQEKKICEECNGDSEALWLKFKCAIQFYKRRSWAALIVAAVVSSQSISSSTGDSCSWQHTNHCHLQWVSFVHRSKKKNELEQTNLSLFKLNNQNGFCQHPSYRSTFALLSLYDADPVAGLTDRHDVSELGAFIAFSNFRKLRQN